MTQKTHFRFSIRNGTLNSHKQSLQGMEFENFVQLTTRLGSTKTPAWNMHFDVIDEPSSNPSFLVSL